MEERAAKRTWESGRWLVLVLAVGLVVGLVLALVVAVPGSGPPPGPGSPPLPARSVSQAMTVLSTVNIALLVALLVVYSRTYRSTGAPFILGLWVFLFALLLENILDSPLLFAAFDAAPGGLGRFLAFGQLLMCAALAVFLYLSLE